MTVKDEAIVGDSLVGSMGTQGSSSFFNFGSPKTELIDKIKSEAIKFGYEQDPIHENRMLFKKDSKQVSSFFIWDKQVSFTNHAQAIRNEYIDNMLFYNELKAENIKNASK